MIRDKAMGKSIEGNNSIERLCMTIPEAAKVLGLSRNFGYELARRGEIPVMRFGKRIVVPKAAFERMLGLTSERKATNERTH